MLAIPPSFGLPACYSFHTLPTMSPPKNRPGLRYVDLFRENNKAKLGTRLLNRILPSPLPGGGFVSGSVGLVDMCNFWYQWVVGVWIRQHGADGEEDYVKVSSRILTFQNPSLITF